MPLKNVYIDYIIVTLQSARKGKIRNMIEKRM